MTAVPKGQVALSASTAGSVQLGDVEGGRPTDRLGTSQVSNADLRAAIEASLRAHGLLASAGAAPLTLRTVLADMTQPTAGLDMTVSATVHYTITDQSNATLADHKITTQATATFGDAFYGVKRLRIATERAIRANIAKLVELLKAMRPVRERGASS